MDFHYSRGYGYTEVHQRQEIVALNEKKEKGKQKGGT
jgi:hypothetical protein